jgi:hypothetical protein
MAVDDIVGCRVVGRYMDQNIVNTFHYQIINQAAGEDAILQALSDAWETTNKSDWLARHSDDYSLIGVRAFGVTGVNKVPGITHIDDPGDVVEPEALSPICRTITLYTESDNHRRRGRVMLSGSTAGMFDPSDGTVTLVEIAALVPLAILLTTLLTSGGNSFQPGLPPSGELPWEPYTGYKARLTPSVIRSRRVRGLMIG